MKITLLATTEYCPHCGKTVWMHNRGEGRFVCRGEIRPSMDYEKAVADGRFPGCQREFRRK